MANESFPTNYKSATDLVATIAKRAAELANESMDALRLLVGYYEGADSDNQARITCKGYTRGQMVEAALLEEFENAYVEEQ